MDLEIKNDESLKNEIDIISELTLAGKNKRIANYLLDFICISVFAYLIGGILGRLSFVLGIEWINSSGKLVEYLFELAVMFIYYLLFEYYLGFTPGKIITKTKVVTKTGYEPGFLNILGRTSCRFIPFDALSFLSKYSSGGWHDSISGTMVVEDVGKRNLFIPVMISAVMFLLGGVFYLIPEVPINSNNEGSNFQIIGISYKGVNFNYTDNWDVEKKVWKEDFGYQIYCRKKVANETENFLITFYRGEADLNKWMKWTIENATSKTAVKNAKFEDVEEIRFTRYDALSVKFSEIIFGEKYFYQCIFFYDKDKDISVSFCKQAESVKKLEEDFKMIENSFWIN